MSTQEILARGVCIQDNSILLAYFKDKSYFFLPGGHVEAGESVQNALKREISEELSLDATVGDVIMVFEHMWDDEDKSIYEINFLIDLSIPPSSNIHSDVKHLEFKWVSLTELGNINFLPAELKEDILKLLQKKKPRCFKSSIKATS